MDKLEGDGVPEDVLGRIAGAMVRGLKFLKDEMQIIHRGTCAWCFSGCPKPRPNIFLLHLQT